MEPILSEGYGYGFAVGLGAAFAAMMVFITKVLSVYLGQVQNSERFSTASRNVKSGLISSSTVSAWTWPATLLTSGTWGYSHGLSGPYYYGIGGTIQILLFLFIALQIKKRAPKAHTVSECVEVRFGKHCHWLFLCYCVATNVLISALLLLGGSQAFAATTGMSVVAASFLLPVGVVVYTAMGGLKATFITDWIHTVVIFGILLATGYTVYGSSAHIGSPGKMYDLLKAAQESDPSATGHSYLSFRDPTMIYLSWSVMIGGFSSVFGDPGYSQRAIASDHSSVFTGYLLGGLCWTVIPMSLGTSAGLACRALLNSPISATYPNVLTDFEVNAGLPVVYGMKAIFGKLGAAAALAMLFMSVTSATSAELIAFSSVCTYDVYRTYVRPDASGKQLVRTAHFCVVGFGIFMAALATGLNYVGVTVGWLLSFLGIILSPEAGIVVLTLFWSKLSKRAILIGAPLSTVTGVVCWIGTTYAVADHVVNRDTLMTPKATFVGNITSIVSTPIFMVALSYLLPDKEVSDLSLFTEKLTLANDVDSEEEAAIHVTTKDSVKLQKQAWASLAFNVVVLVGCYILIPCGLYAKGSDLSKKSFTAYVVIVLIWLTLAALYIIVAPLWQGWPSIRRVVSRMIEGRPVLSSEVLLDSNRYPEELADETTKKKWETDVRDV